MRRPPIRPGVLIACGNPDSGLGGACRALRLSGSAVSAAADSRRPPPNISLSLNTVDCLRSTGGGYRAAMPLCPEETKESYE